MSELFDPNLAKLHTIERITDTSNCRGQRVRVYFHNGCQLSIIRGKYSDGGDQGLFEIMPSVACFDEADENGDSVLGYLSAERVAYYINKIGNMAPQETIQ